MYSNQCSERRRESYKRYNVHLAEVFRIEYCISDESFLKLKKYQENIKTATEMMLRQLVKVTDAYPLTEADIALITTASSLHDIGKIRIPEEILNKPGRLTDEEFKIN